MLNLTDDEFDLLDELYFVQDYSLLKNELGWADERIMLTLDSLYKKAFIKLLLDHDAEFHSNETGESIPWKELYFLASKQGLKAHNGF